MNEWYLRHNWRLDSDGPVTRAIARRMTLLFITHCAILFGVVMILISACAPAAPPAATSPANGWIDLGGNLHAKVIDAHTTCYLYGSSGFSCVYHS